MRFIGDILQTLFGFTLPEQASKNAYLVDDPLFCVARGTGIALEHLDTYKKAIISK